MYLEQDQWQQVNQYTLRYLFDPNKTVKVYTEGKSFMEEINGRDLLKYWDIYFQILILQLEATLSLLTYCIPLPK